MKIPGYEPLYGNPCPTEKEYIYDRKLKLDIIDPLQQAGIKFHRKWSGDSTASKVLPGTLRAYCSP